MWWGARRARDAGAVQESLATAPRIDILRLARVTGLPEFHPEHDTFRPFPVNGFLIHHPDGPIVVDTGIGSGNEFIDGNYPHEFVDLVGELNRRGVDEREVVLIANSHLHFDHCGQNRALTCSVAVQREEMAAARQPHYTVPDWADIPEARAVVIDGDADLAPGVTAMLTPGHTPGHQSVVVRGGDDVTVIAAQCIFRGDAWSTAAEETNLHDASWRGAADESLLRLRSLRPQRVLLAHDEPMLTARP